MTYVLLIIAILLIVAGVIFSVLPPLPGPILSYLGLCCVHLSDNDVQFSTISLVLWGVLVAGITIADYVLPIAATKKFGGTKAGVWGGVIGAVIGVLSPIPFGIVLGPLIGAIAGDLVGGNRFRAALKSGFGSFVGFLVATALKTTVAVAIGIVVFVKMGSYAFQLLTQ